LENYRQKDYSDESNYSLEEIMDLFGTELSILAFSYVKDIEASKDIVQNVFIKCFLHLNTFQGKSSLKTWLYRITINQCKDYIKSNYFKKILLVGYTREAETKLTPETITLKKVENEEVIRQIMALSKKYREVLILRYIHQLEIKEIANVLSLSAETVKTRIRRAKLKLLPAIKWGFFNE
jgi:RNA polymerase sigma-70 factor, ECF subfamily